MFGSEVMQYDARGFDNKGICYSSHKVKKTGDVGIKNNGRDAPEFLVYDGLMMLHHPLICGLTAVVLYDQDLMGDQLKLCYNCEHVTDLEYLQPCETRHHLRKRASPVTTDNVIIAR